MDLATSQESWFFSSVLFFERHCEIVVSFSAVSMVSKLLRSMGRKLRNCKVTGIRFKFCVEFSMFESDCVS